MTLLQSDDNRNSPSPGRTHATPSSSGEAGRRLGPRAVSDRLMALAGIIGAVSDDAADLLACRDLAEQIVQDRYITEMVICDLDSADLQCFLINSDTDLAPYSPFVTAMFTVVPLAFSIYINHVSIGQFTKFLIKILIV